MNQIKNLVFFLDPRITDDMCIDLVSWLNDKFQANLHIITPIGTGRDIENAVLKAKELSLAQSVSFHEHGTLENFPQTSIIKEFSPNLIIYNVIRQVKSPDESQNDLVPSIANLLRDNTDPTLFVPEPYSGKIPWTNLMVTLSGERHTQAAFSLAIDIGQQLGLKLHLIHVMDKNETNVSKTSLMSGISDVAHLELPMVLEELLYEGAPYSSSADWQQLIENFSLCQGNAETEIKAYIRKHRPDLLVMQWRGHLLKGRALVLAAMLKEIPCPILIVRAPDQIPSVLGVDQHYFPDDS